MIHWALQANAGWAAAPRGADAASALTAGERARLETLRVPKRRDDWLLGRTAAKSVVAQALRRAVPHAWAPEALEIASEPSGMPYARLAPEAQPVDGFRPGERLPVSVTISHTAGHALCAATWVAPPGAAPAQALGADLGQLEPRSPAFVATFFTEAEQEWVRCAGWWERDLRANLVWCAKEAVLKALGLGLTVDTRSIDCRLQPGRADPQAWPLSPADAGAWSPFTATCSAAALANGGTVRGVWRAFPGFVGALASWSAGTPREGQ